MKTIRLLDRSEHVENEFHAWKTIPKDAVFFEGHYPDNKILPGVFHMELAVITAKELLRSLELNFTRLVKVTKFRFLQLVLPGETVFISISIKECNDFECVISANLFVDDKKVSSGVFVMGNNNREFASSTPDVAPLITEDSSSLGYDKIIEILPHRYPFIQLDRVINITGNDKITGLKNITASDHMFWGLDTLSPFPKPIIIEGLSQCAGILGLQLMKSSGVALFGYIKNIDFLGDAFPGDQLIFEASIVRVFSDNCVMSGRVWVKDRLICTVENMASSIR